MTLMLLTAALAQDTSDATPEDDVEPTTEEAEVVQEVEEEPDPWANLPDIPGQVRPDNSIWELELYYHNAQYGEGLKTADQMIAADPGNADLYWHAARFKFEIAEGFERTDTTMDKEQWYLEMLAYTETGLKLDPNNAHLHFAKGIALGRLGTTRGVLASLFTAETIESSWTQCAESSYVYRSIAGEEQLPCDCDLTLGIFYRLVPDSFLVDLIAGTSGDLDKSLAHHQRADQCKPRDIGIMKEMGATQLCIGDKRGDGQSTARGKATLEAGLTIAPQTPNEHIDIGHMRMLINNPGLACEYSRDGQQDLDESQLEN